MTIPDADDLVEPIDLPSAWVDPLDGPPTGTRFTPASRPHPDRLER